MAAMNDDNDLGAILLALAIMVMVAGGIYFMFHDSDPQQTALSLPVLDRTVPTIVPQQPR
jgi:hypothetical protein